MKKICSLLVFIGSCITVSGTIHAMRTGATRKESRQTQFVALKHARVVSKALFARHLASLQSRTLVTPYAENNASGQFIWPTDVGEYSSRPVFAGTNSHRFLACLLMAMVLMQSAQVALADDSPVKKVAEAVAASSDQLYLGLGGTAAIHGMTTLMEKTSQFVVARCEGILDGKLGAGADNFGRLLHEYTEYEKTDPVKARASLSGLTVLTKGVAGGVAGGIRGGLATAPVGGEGVIPGAIGGTLFGLAKGLAEEAFGIVAGEAVHRLTGDAIPEYIEKSIKEFAPKLRHFDRTLTDEQTIHYSILIGCAALSSTEMTPIIKEAGHLNLASFASVLKNIPRETTQSGLKDFELAMREVLERPYEGALEEGLYHLIEHGMQQTFEEGKDHGSLYKSTEEFRKQSWQEALPFKEVLQHLPLPAQTKSYDFTGDAQKLTQHEQFKQWKAESESLHIAIPQGLDFVNQYAQQERDRPLSQYEGAAGNAWYNEQQARRRAGL